MADGLLWHAGAFAFALWLAFLYVKRKTRLEELDGAVVVLLSWPAGEPPPAALVRRALRFCEEECLDVLGTRVALALPNRSDGASAVASLLSSLRASRLSPPSEKATAIGTLIEGVMDTAQRSRSDSPLRAEWRAGAWRSSIKGNTA